MQLKVCGITKLEQVSRLEALKINFAGFIFYDRSPRYVVNRIRPAALANFEIQKVGVFVNASLHRILNIVDAYHLDYVQLHGDESPQLCKALMKYVKVIKAFRISTDADVDELTAVYKDVCDLFLFDTAPTDHSYGGTGRKFDWSLLRHVQHKFMLSGGIAPGDIEAIKTFDHPHLYGVDINSRFETFPGIKDMDAITTFSKKIII